jgi:putative DNA primase/helicase
MADLVRLLGRAFTPPRVDHLPPQEQLSRAMEMHGITPPTPIHLDGRLHRFKLDAKDKARSGWYVAYNDNVPAGSFGSWRDDVKENWRADIGRHLTAAEELEHAKRMAEMKAIRDAETEKRHEVAANVVETIWRDLAQAPADHPYLIRKGIKPHDLRVTGDGRLVAPIFDSEGDLSSLQYINDQGAKQYHGAGAVDGCFAQIGELTPGTLYVVEGYATGATVHEVTKRPVVVAFSAYNLVAVAGHWSTQADVCVVADNDRSGVGQRYAEQAAAKHGVRYVVPPTLGDANDYVQSGRDLAVLLAPRDTSDWLVAADDFSAQPAPLSWLVKGWLQAMALHMVHGPSGSGKTFLVLDWCCHLSAGAVLWHETKVRPGPVVYLAGEGHHGLRGRVAAWKAHHGIDHLDMWISRSGVDLDKPDGLRQALDSLRALPRRPCLVVVDTLHRFLGGDENSAQDAKAMLDSCAAIMAEAGCSVLLVHHTGVNEEAQARARGSSAWRGALDIEISLSPAKGDGPITVTQRKSKDAEATAPIHGELAKVEIPGWVDEDGEPVTSAVWAASVAPVAPVKESPAQRNRKTVERAWWASGAEVRDGAPYIARSALKEFLAEAMGWTEGTIAQNLKPSAAPGMVVRDMLDGAFFTPHEHGWVISDPVRASALILSKRSG